MTQEISMTQSLLDRYYEEEKARRERELSLASVQVRLDASDLAMLGGIAKRFQKTKDEVAGELLSSALLDIFSRLEAGERKLLARDCDEAARQLADEIAEENGVHSIDFKPGAWANHERQIVKQERKRARQAENNSKGTTANNETQDSKAAEIQSSDTMDVSEAPSSTEAPAAETTTTNTELPDNATNEMTDSAESVFAD